MNVHKLDFLYAYRIRSDRTWNLIYLVVTLTDCYDLVR